MRITILLYFMHVIVAHGEHGPFNTAVVAGHPVSMTCGNNSIGSSIQWIFKKSNELGERSVFDGSRTYDGFTVNFVTTELSVDVVLTKRNTKLEDAGIYKCLIIRPNQAVIRTAQLIVLASDPKCGTNKSSEGSGILEDTYVNMWCNISFAGDLVPIMKWSRNDGKEFEGTTNKSTGYIALAITEELKAEDNGKIYSCTTYLDLLTSTDASQPGITRARNALNYRYQWNFTAGVWARPGNLYVEPLKEWYNYGDRLRCWGDVDTTLTYRWVSVKTGIVTYGQYVTIDDTLAENVLHVYQCIATYEKPYANISKTVNITIRYQSAQGGHVSEITVTQQATYVIGSICIILLILVIGMIVIRVKGVVRPFLQRELNSEPDIVQYLENEGGYERPEEIILGILHEQPEENEHQQEVEAAGFASCLFDEPVTSGSPIYSEINKPKTVSGVEENNAFDRYVQPVSPCPIYAAVRKTRKGEEPDSNDSCLSNENDNAEVNNIQSEFIKDNQAMKMSSEEEEKKQISVTESGKTEYLDMAGFRMPSTSRTTSSKPTSPMFSMSDYASIDHTVMPPPPPKLD